MVLWKIWRKLAKFRFSKFDNSCIRRRRTQNFPNPPANFEELKLLPDSETKFGAWIWRLLISWREIIMELNTCSYGKTCLTEQWTHEEWRRRIRKKLWRHFRKWLRNATDLKKIWVDRGTEFAVEFKKFCAGAGIEIYSTMSETKAAFAERTIRSLKKIMYRYMEDYGYKYIHKLPQFVT